MIKKIVNWMLPFWIYAFLFFVLNVLWEVVPNDTDWLWLIAFGFIPHLYVGIYFWGIFLGWVVQKKSCIHSIYLQLILAIITFVVSVVIFTLFTYRDIRGFMILNVIPSAGFSILFFVAEIVTKKAQVRQKKA